ncbi:hypothetical protein DFJ63DRAFT_337685 [Scheffersomyces coipomensis]|uniref:uncharacterized protein n=1 Tax=Scheffersomyces coipomensis TaxID=1788519 RepID=UPI00315D1A86
MSLKVNESVGNKYGESTLEPETFADIVSCLKSDKFKIDSPQLNDEITDELLLAFRQSIEGNITNDPIRDYTFDWERLGECYTFVFDDYIKNIELINQETAECDEERRKWTADCFKNDEESSIERINKSEQWISLKEVQLHQMKQQIKNTIDLIKGEVQKFKSLTTYE